MRKAKMLYRSCMNESEWGGRLVGWGVFRDPTAPAAQQGGGHATQDSCQRGCAPTGPLGPGSPGDTALLPAACDPIYSLTPAQSHIIAGGKW